jgi:molecular chaperone HscB
VANPFETLGLAPTFALDPASLEQRQRELNRAVHPDRHAGKSPAERRQALSRAMDINLAYRTLRDPASRAEALFELLGAGGTRESTISDPVLLLEMLEQREALEQARQSKDLARLRGIGALMAERERRVTAALESAFAPLLGSTSPSQAALSQTALSQAAPSAPAVRAEARAEQLAGARQLLAELRYVRRFAEEIAVFEDES